MGHYFYYVIKTFHVFSNNAKLSDNLRLIHLVNIELSPKSQQRLDQSPGEPTMILAVRRLNTEVKTFIEFNLLRCKAFVQVLSGLLSHPSRNLLRSTDQQSGPISDRSDPVRCQLRRGSGLRDSNRCLRLWKQLQKL